jgi:hypothetical protein
LLKGLQYFIPLFAIITILGVLWHYKGRLEDDGGHQHRQPEFEELLGGDTGHGGGFGDEDDDGSGSG